MFYCDPCARHNAWPRTPYKSHGQCEMCGDLAVCNDMPSDMLPDPDVSVRMDYEIQEQP